MLDLPSKFVKLKNSTQGGNVHTVNLLKNGIPFKRVEIKEGFTIKQMLQQEKIQDEDFIAYKIPGSYVFSEYEIEKDVTIDLVHFGTREGYRILQDSTFFVMMKAFNNIFPAKWKLVVEHSIGDGVYFEIFEDHVLTFDEVKEIKDEMKRIIQDDLKIEKIRVKPSEAEEIFTPLLRDDVIKNLNHHNLTIYKCGEYYDYYLRQLVERTSHIKDFDLIYHAPGIILRLPQRGKYRLEKDFRLPKNLFSAHQEHDKWLNILDIHNASGLNRIIEDYDISESIQIEEALHEKKIVNIAEQISRKKDVRLILIAGPSSSGKTTFAKRLSVQLRVNGIYPKIIGMDDYFVSRHLTPIKENGDFDFESLDAIDLSLLNNHLTNLLAGNSIELPKYNFVTGMAENSHRELQIKDNEVLILEGIHGLNDRLTASVPFNQKVKIYVSALNNLNIDAHNRIPTTDSRKFRRILRDSKYRGHTAEQTIEMWDSVRDGEDVNIFPYQENADFMFNSILTYEICVLKKYVLPLLKKINCYSNQYLEAKRLIQILQHVKSIDDGLVPTNSILREFIGGSVFNY